MPLGLLIQKFPLIPWKEYFTKILPVDIKIDENNLIDVQIPLEYLTDFINLIDITPKRVQANYAIARAVRYSVNLCFNDEIRNRTQQYEALRRGSLLNLPTRSDECFEFIDSLQISIDALYARKYFNKETKINAVEIVNNIRKQLAVILHEVCKIPLIILTYVSAA